MKRTSLHRYLAVVLTCVSCVARPCFAQSLQSTGSSATQLTLPRGAEYSIGQFPGEVLIPIHVLGAVVRPGLYHVPKHTDLLYLITVAGGAPPNAELTEAVIKRRVSGQEEVIAVDLEKLMTARDGRNPTLMAGDVVFVPMDEPLISQETSGLLAFIATMLSIITTSILLEDRLSRD